MTSGQAIISTSFSSDTSLLWSLEEALDKFIASLPDKRAQNTRLSYRLDLRQFIAWLNSRGLEMTGRISPDDLRDYKQECLRQERTGRYKATTINRRLVAVRRFLIWLTAEAAVFDRAPNGQPWLTETRIRQFLADIPASRQPKRRELAPTPEEVARFLGVIQHPRDKALFMTIIGAGLRISEALALRACDFRERKDGAGIIYVAQGKGGRPREVEIAAEVIQCVQEWCKVIGLDLGLDEAGLWPRRAELDEKCGKDLDRFRAYDLVVHYRRLAKIKKRFSPHNFRHFYGQNFYEAFRDVMRLKDNLGHANLTTVQVYVRGAAVETAQPLQIPKPQGLEK